MYDNIRCFKHDFFNFVQALDGYVKTKIATEGGNQPHNNMPPYEIVGYMWIRRS